MAPALLTAFSTASSAATLPFTLESVERAGVSQRTASFVLPLGVTINMDGTALYECVAVIFLAQAYDVHLDFATQLLIVVTAVVTSIGVAGIPLGIAGRDRGDHERGWPARRSRGRTVCV